MYLHWAQNPRACLCSYGGFSYGLKNKFVTAVINEPSVFEPIKVLLQLYYLDFY